MAKRLPANIPGGPTCPACRKPWETHPGLSALCKKLEAARCALQIIHTWSTFENGFPLNAKDTAALTTKVLREIS